MPNPHRKNMADVARVARAKGLPVGRAMRRARRLSSILRRYLKLVSKRAPDGRLVISVAATQDKNSDAWRIANKVFSENPRLFPDRPPLKRRERAAYDNYMKRWGFQ